jgi:hypothetical protein
MSYKYDKNGQDNDILVYGYEAGIAPSPHKGIANIQNANIATEEGEVMASYGRVQNSMTSTSATGTLTFTDATHVGLSIAGSNNKFKGQWITVSGSTHGAELADGTYYVSNTSAGGSFQLEATYNGAIITGYTSGLTATINLFRVMGRGIAYATESYFSSGVQRYRYYILDDAGLVWMYDTSNDVFPSDDLQYWVLPDNSVSYWSTDTKPSGLAILNGWLIVMSGNKFWVKQTVKLGSGYVQMTNAYMMSLKTTSNPHYGLTGHQGRMYYTDGDYVGEIFPNTSIEVNGIPNIQSYASYTAVTTTCTITDLISGSVPSDGAVSSTHRVPVVFFPSTGGTKPTNVTVGVVYYIAYSLGNENFQVFAAASGGAAIDMSGGTGTQYFNTFYPVGTHAGPGGDHTTMVFSPQRVNLPVFETSKFLNEIGNTVLIGTRSSVIYPWNQVDATPSGIINLPETDTQYMLTVNQMAYIFAGYKGNIYITDGSTASLVLKIPDYCAGIAGTPSSYIEPRFTWGGAGYVRGRVYFSVLDQTLLTQSSLQDKAGNCGGIWSFYPTQNIAIGQDTGLALRLENQNSYATYNGYATLIIPWFDQTAGKGPQYFSSWQSTIVAASATYGIDKTNTQPTGPYVLEIDLIPVGTMLNKYTPKQIEYKMASPLASGESVAMKWRKNATDSFTSGGTAITEGNTALSGYFNTNFQGAQWVQLQFTVTVGTDSQTTFGRLNQIRMR